MKRSPLVIAVSAAVGGLLLLSGPRLCAQTPPARASGARVVTPGDTGRARELTETGVDLMERGRSDPSLFREAMRAFEAAIASDPSAIEPRVRLANLFLDKYNSRDAQSVIEEAMRIAPEHPGVLLAAARRLVFDAEPGAADLARRIVAADPEFAPARAFLARLQLEVEDYAQAAAEAEEALKRDPSSTAAFAVLAGSHYLRGDRRGYETVRRRAAERGAETAEFYTTLAELSVRNRLYREGAEFARRAWEVDSTAWEALALLGMNELRTGDIATGRAHLERAFAGDPFNVWVKNTLDLFDIVARYDETKTDRFLILADPEEAELLAIYAAELAEAAYDSLSRRYDFRPATPVRLEFYRRHADFSVRAVGLAGLGALGVSFGNVLAMDSPAARDPGAFNWGSTLWHEVAHAFTLGASDHQVPRWLSEGLSVLEERRARPGWGADVSPPFIAAYKAGALPPVSRLNDGFIRPKFPEQVMLSYVMASLVCEMIAAEHGDRALVAMLRGYRDGLSTAAVFRQVLRSEPAAFDTRFDLWFRDRYAQALRAIDVKAPPVPSDAAGSGAGTRSQLGAIGGEYVDRLREGREAFDAGRLDDAQRALERAKALFPEYAGDGSPHALLAEIHARRGDRRRAADELLELVRRDETAYDANVRLAGHLAALGDRAGAAAALERAIYISPTDPAVHTRLAELATELGDHARAVRERRALVALQPADMAEALYQLALAYRNAGDRTSARRTVLRALERAPSFERAQQLLLELRSDRGGAR